MSKARKRGSSSGSSNGISSFGFSKSRLSSSARTVNDEFDTEFSLPQHHLLHHTSAAHIFAVGDVSVNLNEVFWWHDVPNPALSYNDHGNACAPWRSPGTSHPPTTRHARTVPFEYGDLALDVPLDGLSPTDTAALVSPPTSPGALSSHSSTTTKRPVALATNDPAPRAVSIDSTYASVTVVASSVLPIVTSTPITSVAHIPLSTLTRLSLTPAVDPILSYTITVPIARPTRIKCLRLSNDGILAVAALDEEELSTYRVPPHGPAPSRSSLYHLARFRHSSCVLAAQNQLTACAFSPDGKYLLTAARDCMTFLWDVQTNRMCKSVDHEGGAVLTAAFSPDGSQVVVGKQDKRCTVFDARRGDVLGMFVEHKDPVLCVAWSPNGRLCCSASADKKAYLWRPRMGAVDAKMSLWDPSGFPILHTLPHKGFVLTCAFSADSAFVLTNDDRAVYLWRTSTGECVRVLTNPEMPWPADANRALAASLGPHFAKGAPGQLTSPRFLASAFISSGHVVVSDVSGRIRLLHPLTFETELEIALPVPVYVIHSAGPSMVLGDGVGNVFYVRLQQVSDKGYMVGKSSLAASDPTETAVDLACVLNGLPPPIGQHKSGGGDAA